jgi:hypothetical protein
VLAIKATLTISVAGNKTLKELGRWDTTEMIDRYAHLSQEHLAQAFERISSPEQNAPTVFITTRN